MQSFKTLIPTRVILLSVFSLIILIILISFFKISSSTTDENQWIDLPSKFYLTHHIEGEIIEETYENKKNLSPAYNLILSVNDVKLESISQLNSIIKNSQNQNLILKILDITNLKSFSYKTDKNNFDISSIKIMDSAVQFRD